MSIEYVVLRIPVDSLVVEDFNNYYYISPKETFERITKNKKEWEKSQVLKRVCEAKACCIINEKFSTLTKKDYMKLQHGDVLYEIENVKNRKYNNKITNYYDSRTNEWVFVYAIISRIFRQDSMDEYNQGEHTENKHPWLKNLYGNNRSVHKHSIYKYSAKFWRNEDIRHYPIDSENDIIIPLKKICRYSEYKHHVRRKAIYRQNNWKNVTKNSKQWMHE